MYGTIRFWDQESSGKEQAILNVYDWYGVLSPELLKQFEKETGIKVNYDVYESNDSLEAKLLAGRSGYDIVFPSALPYAARQIQIGVYQPIQFSKLSNWKNIHPIILKHMKKIDPSGTYILPYYWGTLGVVLDKDKVSKTLNKSQWNESDLLFDPQTLKKLSKCGVSLLTEATDIFPLVLHYLKKSPYTRDPKDYKEALKHLSKIRPYIKRFSSGRFINDIVSGDLCVAQAWSGEAHKAIEEGQELGKRIEYVIPQEGTELWIDCIGIPARAPHPNNAHRFVNFILRKKIAASITNRTNLATVVLDALPFIKKSIRDNPNIFPSPKLLSKCFMEIPHQGHENREFDRMRTRALAAIRFKMG